MEFSPGSRLTKLKRGKTKREAFNLCPRCDAVNTISALVGERIRLANSNPWA